MKTKTILVGFLLAILFSGCGTGGNEKAVSSKEAKEQTMSNQGFAISENPDARQVDITYDGKPFTSYCYWENLKKPVLYPLRADDGRVVTRSYPAKMVPGEPADHPHHLSCWFNYGNVNGDDYWGHTSASRPGGKYGTIVHRKIGDIANYGDSLRVDFNMDWIGSKGDKVLEETDRIYFRVKPGLNIIDRLITLTALDNKVVFGDTKEGMFAIRVTHELEEPANQPARYVDAHGNVTEVAQRDNAGVDGEYLSSEGRINEKEVWGTRAKWCILRGTVQGKPATIGIFDHPDNAGYPTYWHARGYGLFAANPFGWKTFTNGEKELNFTLAPGESTTLRYRILIASRRLDAEQTEKLFENWLKEIGG